MRKGNGYKIQWDVHLLIVRVGGGLRVGGMIEKRETEELEGLVLVRLT